MEWGDGVRGMEWGRWSEGDGVRGMEWGDEVRGMK